MSPIEHGEVYVLDDGGEVYFHQIALFLSKWNVIQLGQQPNFKNGFFIGVC